MSEATPTSELRRRRIWAWSVATVLVILFTVSVLVAYEVARTAAIETVVNRGDISELAEELRVDAISDLAARLREDAAQIQSVEFEPSPDGRGEVPDSCTLVVTLVDGTVSRARVTPRSVCQ